MFGLSQTRTRIPVRPRDRIARVVQRVRRDFGFAGILFDFAQNKEADNE
ncbi:hypothetical protein [Paraburkholderia rhizosphaerae]|uniref:Uncharacterized protein n=1 Tax=Paraburkholderia rhizosphaerae TaxID=480658 RepID=A0A4R8LI44_9BURK|nr:hypothetical protein [Paraburkholderia rhizosphaerae]TDY42965.1 hypothetical protein BX592_11982 [Paraburkholderia rhizosphaerae]